MLLCCDDVGEKHKQHLVKLEDLKARIPSLKVTCFVIAKDLSDEVRQWLKQDWIEVAVHGWDHDYPPECEREDREERIVRAYESIRELLPKKFGFRAPGFQMTASTYPILRKMGFWYIAHQTRIQPLKDIVNYKQQPILNTHIYESINVPHNRSFHLCHEGFNSHAD